MTTYTLNKRPPSPTLPLDDFNKYIEDRVDLANSFMSLASMMRDCRNYERSNKISDGLLSVAKGSCVTTATVFSSISLFPLLLCPITAAVTTLAATGFAILGKIKSIWNTSSSIKKKQSINAAFWDIIVRLSPIIAKMDSKTVPLLSKISKVRKDLESLGRVSPGNPLSVISDTFSLYKKADKGIDGGISLMGFSLNDIDLSDISGVFGMAYGVRKIYKGLQDSENSLDKQITNIELIGTKIREDTNVIRAHREHIQSFVNSHAFHDGAISGGITEESENSLDGTITKESENSLDGER